MINKAKLKGARLNMDKKKLINGALKYVLTFFVLILSFIILLTITSLIPREAMKEKKKQQEKLEILEEQEQARQQKHQEQHQKEKKEKQEQTKQQEYQEAKIKKE